jgi:hypothetical protein
MSSIIIKKNIKIYIFLRALIGRIKLFTTHSYLLLACVVNSRHMRLLVGCTHPGLTASEVDATNQRSTPARNGDRNRHRNRNRVHLCYLEHRIQVVLAPPW